MVEKERKKGQLLTIGEMAKLCDISIQTLRYYDAEGILVPQYKDEKTGYRYYAMENVAKFYLIKQLRHLDMSIEYIKGIKKRDNVGAIMTELNVKIEAYKEEIKKLQKKQIESEQLLALLREAKTVSEEEAVCEKNYQKRNVIKTRARSSCDQEGFLKRCAQLLQIVWQNDLHITGEMTAKFYGSMYQIDKEQADIEISLTVIEDKMQCQLIQEEEGYMGVCKRYVGAYEKMQSQYKEMLDYMKEKQYELPPYFICRYLISNVYSESGEEYVTDIILPINK